MLILLLFPIEKNDNYPKGAWEGEVWGIRKIDYFAVIQAVIFLVVYNDEKNLIIYI